LQASGPFVIAYSNSSPRNDFSGFVGMSFTIGGSDLSVQALGRVCLSGNLNTHAVKLVSASTGADVAGGSVSVAMSGCSAGQFVYGNLPSAVTLSKGIKYYVVSQETAGGDTWYDLTGSITVTADAQVNGPLYSYNGAWIQNGTGKLSYVPVNFQYSIGGGGGGGTLPTASITNPSNNATVSGPVQVTATAAATAPATVASVQFLLDGNDLGSALTGAPYSVNWDTTAVLNGSHTLTAAVRDSTGQSGTSSQISVVVNNTGSGGGSSGGTPLVASFSATAGNVRKDYSGFVGMAFTVNPSTAMVVSALGRVCLSGNSGTHLIKLVYASTGQDVPAASVSVPMNACAPGQFAYATLPNAIQLTAGSSYYLVSQETTGGDTWYDSNGVSVNSVTVNGSLYSWNGGWIRNGDGARSYVPPNLKFSLAGSSNTPPTVTITSPTTSATISGTFTVSVVAQASSPATISSVTYYLDGVSLGAGSAAQGFSLNWDTTTTNDGSHTLTALATDSAGLTTMSAPVSFMVNNGSGSGGGSGGGGGTPFVTTYGFFNPTLRNDFDSFVGMQLMLTGSTPLTVTYVGRGCVAGNSQSHTVKFVYEESGLDVPGGAASVNMAGCTPGGFAWAALPAPISLMPGVAYYLASLEYTGGDMWYEKAPITTAAFATDISAIYLQDNGAWDRRAPPNYSYGPPNFK
jgi:hypothetical protein